MTTEAFYSGIAFQRPRRNRSARVTKLSGEALFRHGAVFRFDCCSCGG